MINSANSNQVVVISNTQAEDTAKVKKAGGFQMPTLDQFMDLITDEHKSVISTPSGYNVYNKYHKTS